EPKAPTASARPVNECAFCHIHNAKKDEVWTHSILCWISDCALGIATPEARRPVCKKKEDHEEGHCRGYGRCRGGGNGRPCRGTNRIDGVWQWAGTQCSRRQDWEFACARWLSHYLSVVRKLGGGSGSRPRFEGVPCCLCITWDHRRLSQRWP